MPDSWQTCIGLAIFTWYPAQLLTLLPLVPHICVSESVQHCFRKWLVAYSAPSHYLNQCWVIGNWTPRNKLQWIFNQNIKLFRRINGSENIVFEMADILSRGDELIYIMIVQHCLFTPLVWCVVQLASIVASLIYMYHTVHSANTSWNQLSHPPWKIWPPFRRRHFQMHFREWKVVILIKMSLQFFLRFQ